MIVASRLSRRAYAAFDGEGGFRRSGRWHEKGNPVVYASSSEALAALEVLVHLSLLNQIPEYVCVKAAIPEDLIADIRDLWPLPSDWTAEEPIQTRGQGTKWLLGRHSVVLKVPSVVIPREANFMINPLHPSAHRIELSPPLPFEFDLRLLGRVH